jgi:hypothetical protein
MTKTQVDIEIMLRNRIGPIVIHPLNQTRRLTTVNGTQNFRVWQFLLRTNEVEFIWNSGAQNQGEWSVS